MKLVCIQKIEVVDTVQECSALNVCHYKKNLKYKMICTSGKQLQTWTAMTRSMEL